MASWASASVRVGKFSLFLDFSEWDSSLCLIVEVKGLEERSLVGGEGAIGWLVTWLSLVGSVLLCSGDSDRGWK